MGEILRGNADVDRILEFDRRSLLSQVALYARLARGGYDGVLDLLSNPRSAWMTALTRARIRAGYDLPGRRYAYTLAVPREPVGPDGPIPRYAPEAALDVLRALGVPPRGLALRFDLDRGAEERMDGWLRSQGLDGRPFVACLPTGTWPAKTWPPERFTAAMAALARDFAVVWLWGPGERDRVQACRARMKAPSHLAPATGWQELGALLSRSALWIGNDSGPKHLAVALGVPTVTVFGPTHPRTWHPPEGPHAAVEVTGLECLHCNATVCPLAGADHMRCMRDLDPARVVDAARALARERAGSCASR
jgi:ADP-heptose:LPS heptosyltransferase